LNCLAGSRGMVAMICVGRRQPLEAASIVSAAPSQALYKNANRTNDWLHFADCFDDSINK
jgi:hypothetical protein